MIGNTRLSFSGNDVNNMKYDVNSKRCSRKSHIRNSSLEEETPSPPKQTRVSKWFFLERESKFIQIQSFKITS